MCLSVRRFSCGCVFCMREAAAAPASAGPSNFTDECVLDQDNSIATVRRKDNPGVALQRRTEQEQATKFCEKHLKSGKILAFSVYAASSFTETDGTRQSHPRDFPAAPRLAGHGASRKLRLVFTLDCPVILRILIATK